jgi:hypothetical protein
LGHVWGADRIDGLCCGRCGVRLGAGDIAQLLEEKASQLAQFGLLTRSFEAHPPAIRLWKD